MRPSEPLNPNPYTLNREEFRKDLKRPVAKQMQPPLASGGSFKAFYKGIYKGIYKGYKGIYKGIYKGYKRIYNKGFYKGIYKGIYKGYKGILRGLGFRIRV